MKNLEDEKAKKIIEANELKLAEEKLKKAKEGQKDAKPSDEVASQLIIIEEDRKLEHSDEEEEKEKLYGFGDDGEWVDEDEDSHSGISDF